MAFQGQTGCGQTGIAGEKSQARQSRGLGSEGSKRRQRALQAGASLSWIVPQLSTAVEASSRALGKRGAIWAEPEAFSGGGWDRPGYGQTGAG